MSIQEYEWLWNSDADESDWSWNAPNFGGYVSYFGNPAGSAAIIGSESGSAGTWWMETSFYSILPDVISVSAQFDYWAFVDSEDWVVNQWWVEFEFRFFSSDFNYVGSVSQGSHQIFANHIEWVENVAVPDADSVSFPEGAAYVTLRLSVVWGTHSSAYSWFFDNIRLWIEALDSGVPLGDYTYRGFRVPYPNWDTERATKENMKYIERQLEDYLHAHEGRELDNGNVSLDVVSTGFRFPRQDYTSPGAMAVNMKYMQSQLELYGHDHESQEVGEGGVSG